MDEQVDLVFRDTHLYPENMKITVPRAGHVNRYDEMEDVFLTIKYDLPAGWRNEDGQLVYTYNMTDYDLPEPKEIYVDSVGWFEVDWSEIEGNIIRKIRPRMDVEVQIQVTDIARYFQQLREITSI